MMLIKSYAIGFIYIVCVRAVSIIIFFSHRLKMLTQTPTKWYSLLEIPSRNVTGDTRVNPRSCLLNIYLFGVTEISEPWWLLMLKFVCMSLYLPSDDFNVKNKSTFIGITILCMFHVRFFFSRCDQLCRNLMVLQRSHNKLFRVYRYMYVFNIFCADFNETKINK